jgi:hypothetical protein
VDERGGYGLVERHYRKRIEYQPAVVPLVMELEPQLAKALDEFVGFVVRDFIDSWYRNLNHSKSREFPDAVHTSIYAAFVTLGKSISQVNATDMILAVMKVVIEHVKEYRQFDLTGLDIKDYLEQYPQSRFHRIHSRELIIEKLREQTMKLSLHVLPRADKSSAAVFGICREIVATTVLLPIIDKVTNPVWLNETLLNSIKQKPGEIEPALVDVQEKNMLYGEKWQSYVQAELDNIKQTVEKTTKEIQTADANQMSTLLQKKLDAQKYVDELMELVGQFREHPIVDPVFPIKNIRLSVIYIAPESASNQIMGAIQYMTATHQGKFMVTVKIGDGYVLEKSFKQFQDLFSQIQARFSRLQSSFPKCLLEQNTGYFKSQSVQEGDLESEQFFTWLEVMVKDPVCCFYPPLVQFLQPTKEASSPAKPKVLKNILQSASNMELKSSFQQAINSAGSAISKLSETSTTQSKIEAEVDLPEPEKVESSVISQEDLDIILDVVFTAIEELFSLTNPDQWIRQQSLHLIKVVLKRAFGYQLSVMIASKLESASNQDSFSGLVSGLTNQLWPEGRIWGQGPPPVIHPLHEQERIKHQLFCLLTEQEDVKKSPSFGKVVSSIQNLVGTKNTKSGLLRGFHLVQNQQLNAGLCAEIVEVIVSIVTDLK